MIIICIHNRKFLLVDDNNIYHHKNNISHAFLIYYIYYNITDVYTKNFENFNRNIQSLKFKTPNWVLAN